MHNKPLSSMILAATLAFAAIPASAGVVLYTDPTSWAAAAAGTTVSGVTFGSNAAGIDQLAPFVIGPLSFTGNPYIGGSGTSSTLFGDYYVDGNGSITVSISSSSDVYSFGIYEACSSNCGIFPNQVSATSATQASNVLSNTAINWQQNSTKLFFGFVSDAPITSITFTSNSGNVPTIDLGEASYGTESPTPEAATLILIGSGLGVLARYRRFVTPQPPTASA